MPVYRDAAMLYSVLGETFSQVEKEAPDHLDGLKALMASRLIVRLRCTAPSAEITLNGRMRPFGATYGPSTLRADLTVELTGDTLHEVMLDRLSIKKAVADRRIKVHGPVWKLKVLADLIQGARRFYPKIAPAPRVQ